MRPTSGQSTSDERNLEIPERPSRAEIVPAPFWFLRSRALRSLERRLSAPNAATKVERKKWRCPSCRRRYRVLIDHDPKSCPECEANPPSSAETEKSTKVLLEPDDTLIEILSRFTGHRFSQRTLIRVAVVVACLIATSAVFLAFVQYERDVPEVQPTPLVAAEVHRWTPEVRLSPVVPLPPGTAKPASGNGAAPSTPQAAELASNSAAKTSVIEGNATAQPPAVGADLVAVRNWLKSQRDAADWEEIKWWPSKPVDDDLVKYAGLLKTDRVARLKYRATAENGKQVVLDDVFVFRDNKVRAVPAGENWWWAEWGGWTGLIIQGSRRLLPDENEKIPSIADAAKSSSKGAAEKSGTSQPTPHLSDKPQRVGRKDSSSRSRKALAMRTKGKAPAPWWAKFENEADLDQVRRWLKDNVGEWEEVRWWKARDFIAYDWSTGSQRSVVVLMDDIGRRPVFQGSIGRGPDSITREHVCRIKFRIKPQKKDAKVEDRLFRVDKNTVEPIRDPEHKRHEWHYFPDSHGLKPEAAD
jgi:hypothetical protein